MTEKTKEQFNKNNDAVYKYNVIKKPNENIEILEILNSIQKDSEILSGKIKEYYHLKIILDAKRALHRILFTVTE